MLGFFLVLFGFGQASPPVGLHAHNDYHHKRPLAEALEQGFDSVEADIFLVKGDLLVGHYAWELNPERSLKSLYLDPLSRLEKKGKLKPLWLLVDIKSSDGEGTAKQLARELEEYGPLFCQWTRGVPDQGKVKVVLSGNMPRDWVARQEVRRMALDGREPDLGKKDQTGLTPWVSESWGKWFTYKGKGEMPPDQFARLRTMSEKAASAGQQLRFWGAPDTPETWKSQLSAGVQRIGTDKLAELRSFVDKQKPAAP